MIFSQFTLSVRQLHREFLRAGSNVMQTFTFYASEDKLENRGNYVAEKISVSKAVHGFLSRVQNHCLLSSKFSQRNTMSLFRAEYKNDIYAAAQVLLSWSFQSIQKNRPRSN